jgi:hypothetical protein
VSISRIIVSTMTDIQSDQGKMRRIRRSPQGYLTDRLMVVRTEEQGMMRMQRVKKGKEDMSEICREVVCSTRLLLGPLSRAHIQTYSVLAIYSFVYRCDLPSRSSVEYSRAWNFPPLKVATPVHRLPSIFHFS